MSTLNSFLSPSPTILLPHLPPKTLVGIDLITFTSTANFHGIRDLPRGWHFLYTGTTQLLSLRCGGWFFIGSESETDHNVGLRDGGNDGSHTPHRIGEVMIWRWDFDSETLECLNAASDKDQQDAMRYKANLGSIWQRGGLFRYRSRVPASMRSVPPPPPLTGDEEGNEEELVPVVPRLEVAHPKERGREDYRQKEEEAKEEANEQEGRRDWQGLTDRFSPGLLTRIVGAPTVDVDGRPRWVVTSASAAERDSDDIPGLAQSSSVSGLGADGMVDQKSWALGLGAREQESEFSFLPVDLKMTWREGAVGRERTEAARDRSWALGDLIQRFSNTTGGDQQQQQQQNGENQVLGELQFTFLMGLTLMNYSCLQQWKRLLRLILTCRNAIKEREQFMRDFLRLLLLQLKRCDDTEGGFFELDVEDGGDFLRKLLRGFRGALYEIVQEDGAGSAVKTEFDRLETWVKMEYDWELNRDAVVQRGMLQLEDGEEVEMDINDNDEDDETGEYAPMVVDLGEDDCTIRGDES